MSDKFDFLNLAKRDMMSFESLFRDFNRTSDEDYLIMSSFHLASCVEKLCKFLLIYSNMNCSYTHDITKLVLACEMVNISVPKLISNNTQTLTGWCVDSRYCIDFKGDLNLVNQIYSVVKSWIESLNNLDSVDIKTVSRTNLFNQ